LSLKLSDTRVYEPQITLNPNAGQPGVLDSDGAAAGSVTVSSVLLSRPELSDTRVYEP